MRFGRSVPRSFSTKDDAKRENVVFKEVCCVLHRVLQLPSVAHVRQRENVVFKGVCCAFHASRSLAQAAPPGERENVAVVLGMSKSGSLEEDQKCQVAKNH